MIHEQDTLAFHKKERPGCLLRDLSEVPLKMAGQAAMNNKDSLSQVTPESNALEFYFLNHVMAEVERRYAPDEPLGDALQVVNLYHKALNKIGTRMFHYILITTTREMRHLTNSQEQQLESKHGDENVMFTKKVKGGAQKALYNYSGPLKIGEYLDYLCDVYDKLSWSSAYGGKAWGNVARCIRECVHGKTSIEMMLDTAFTLAHNNGPIFNKGFQYTMYDGSALGTILDCQRAGQIPELIKAGKTFCSRIDTGSQKLVSGVEKLLGVEYQSWVDWDIVEALGSMHTYSHFKQKNNQLYSNDPAYIEAHKEQMAKITAAKEAMALKKAMEEKTKLEIMPGVYVHKSEKKR